MAQPIHRPVGIVGVGRLGLAVCARLVERGFVVTATDVVAEREADALAAGAGWARSAAAVAIGADRVVTVLPGAAEVAAVVESLVNAMDPGATWIEMSSADAATAALTAAAAERRGIRVIDAPVGGGPAAAREGRLLTFVGGTAADLEAGRDVLEALAERVLAVGPAGSGYTAKLLVNALWFTQAVAHAEVLSVATRAGMDPETMRLAIQASAAASRFGERDLPALLRGDDLTSFALARCRDQLAAVVTLGQRLDVPLAVIEQVASLHEQALARYGDADGELLGARLVTERAGVDLAAAVTTRPGG